VSAAKGRANANLQKLTADWLHHDSQPLSGLTIHPNTLYRLAISGLKVRTVIMASVGKYQAHRGQQKHSQHCQEQGMSPIP
jgi:hypothetical protein